MEMRIVMKVDVGMGMGMGMVMVMVMVMTETEMCPPWHIGTSRLKSARRTIHESGMGSF